MEEEGSLCQTCFVGTLHLSAGILVCDTCGMTQQSFLEETQEYQGTHRRTTVRTGPNTQTPSWRKVEERASLPIRDALEAYICAFQDLLQVQISQMIRLGLVSTYVSNVIKDMWFLYVQQVKILEPKFYQDIEVDIQESNDKVMTSDSSIQFSRRSVIISSHLNRCLPLSLSLAFLFLGCWISRETVDPFDIARLSACGHVEYLGFWRRYKSTLEPYLTIFSKSYFCPTGVSGPAKIYLESRKLSTILKLKCPPLNTMAWNYRYIHALGIQKNLLGPLSVCGILYGGLLNSEENFLCHKSKTPWSSIAARSSFYLDVIFRCSKGREHIDAAIRTSFQYILDAARLMPNNISLEDVIQLSLAELKTFLKFFQGTYFQYEHFGKLDFILDKLAEGTEPNANTVSHPKLHGNQKQYTVILENTPEIRQSSSQDASLSILQVSLTYLSWGSMKHTIKVIYCFRFP